MKYIKKIKKAEESNIIVPDEIKFNKKIVGIYKIFAKNNYERVCLYIGKSTNIANRLFGPNGHIYKYLNDNCKKLVPKLIDKYIKLKYEIEIKIIKVDYTDTSFSRAAHRLAYTEINEIIKHQKCGECLQQLPEGVSDKEKKYWEKNYKKYNSK